MSECTRCGDNFTSPELCWKCESGQLIAELNAANARVKELENRVKELEQDKRNYSRSNASLVVEELGSQTERDQLKERVKELEHENNRLSLSRERYVNALKRLEGIRKQRDQLLHLLQGGTLTDAQVQKSGLGTGVLVEQRHHEAMRCKAEKERDQLRAELELAKKCIKSALAVREHMMGPGPDCSEGKKLAFARASRQQDIDIAAYDQYKDGHATGSAGAGC